eukprot:CAMPEP_0177794784 /NCGR_PEP_ID=MMETSP0491_2-20121128/25840_1 /TAXON_ID=63592 /ORGANISM="Tetraselmis chuii, Strain PLY429" /LENGTH=332 /DNA_ID=CAMNT_0019317483 /DNA_START=375 /DNA_END=1370 /DNA_ORIENTATION=+
MAEGGGASAFPVGHALLPVAEPACPVSGPPLDGSSSGTVVNHGPHLLALMQNMFTDKLLTDVVLAVKPHGETEATHRFPTHRMVLSMWSDMFRSMFECSDSAVPGKAQEIPLHGDDPAAIGSLVEYFYTGQLTLDASNVMALLAAADKYHIGPVVDACGRYLGEQINVGSVCQVLERAQRHSAKEAERKCKKLITSKFYKIAQNEAFLALSWSNIKWILTDDALVCESELAVFHAAMRWLAAEPERKMIRFTCFSVSDLGLIDAHPTASLAGDFFLRKLLTAYKATSSPSCSLRPEKSRQYYQFWISGVMHHIPVAVIEAQGWREVYRQPYS